MRLIDRPLPKQCRNKHMRKLNRKLVLLKRRITQLNAEARASLARQEKLTVIGDILRRQVNGT